ncbi:YraN family protein [Candidatus Saccharibacteria bacterium]|nr:YraN family protein [Candidatus Saccharibacteria bacterium]
MTNYSVGHAAEVQAAEYLKQNGFKIHELNWKTKYCEIDIVAKKDQAIYFVEVKSRKNNKQGYGLDYVTPKKLNQMRFAAEMWISNHSWAGEYQLAAIGIDDEKITFLDEL